MRSEFGVTYISIRLIKPKRVSIVFGVWTKLLSMETMGLKKALVHRAHDMLYRVQLWILEKVRLKVV